MGVEDRDWWRDAQKERARKENSFARSSPGISKPSNGLSKGLKWGPFGIVVFWMVVIGLLYGAMNHYLKPKPLIVTASGDLLIPEPGMDIFMLLVLSTASRQISWSIQGHLRSR